MKPLFSARAVLAFCLLVCSLAGSATAQTGDPGALPPAGTGAGLNGPAATDSAADPSAGPGGTTADPSDAAALPTPGRSSGPSINLNLSAGALEPEGLGEAIEIVLLMTLLSLAPALVMTMTCFTRIIIVLSFLKRAMSIQELPPRLVVTGFAMFMTIFIMTPVVDDIHDDAYAPYVAREIDFREAIDRGADRMNEFMLRQTRSEDIDLIVGMAGADRPATPQDVPFRVVVPAFILSEVKTAFQMGFVLFLPFIAIDLVISSILISMGMFTLPPIVVSTPLKLLLFILVDGWNLVVGSLAESFQATP